MGCTKKAYGVISTFNRLVYGVESRLEFRPNPSLRIWAEGTIRRYTLDINHVDLNVAVTGNRLVADYAMVSRANI